MTPPKPPQPPAGRTVRVHHPATFAEAIVAIDQAGKYHRLPLVDGVVEVPEHLLAYVLGMGVGIHVIDEP